MSIRKLGVILASVCASLLIIPVAAGAKTVRATSPTPLAVKSLNNIPVTGKALHKHKSFAGHFHVTHFVTRGGKTFAVGTLTGTFGNKRINRSGVAIPASIAKSTAGDKASTRVGPSCPIVHLVLGPINLNLLGLQVTLGGGPNANQPIVLDITAVPGSGNLLGNLLCNVAGLLDNSPLGGLLTGLLNLLNTLTSNPLLGGL